MKVKVLVCISKLNESRVKEKKHAVWKMAKERR
jgi:hypothetical protein